MTNKPYLHVYAQEAEHDDVRIVLTQAALDKLRREFAMLDEEGALRGDCAMRIPNVAMCKDGEWFDVTIELHKSADTFEAEISDLPYATKRSDTDEPQ